MKSLYYARHGESEINAKRIWATKLDLPLTRLGRQQAEIAAKQAQHEGLIFELMVVSPLKRAQQTADIIANFITIASRETNELLIERNFGNLEGTSTDEYFKTHAYKDIDLVPGAETVKQLQNRAQKLLDEIVARPEENILLVGHSAFGRALIRCVRHLPWSAEYDQEVIALPHAEIVKLV